MNIGPFLKYAVTDCPECKGTGNATGGHSFFYFCDCIKHPRADPNCDTCKGRGFYDAGGMLGPVYEVCPCLLK